MNKNIYAIGLLACATLGVQSCMDYDDPLDSMQVNDRTIDYHKQVSKEGFAKAREVLEKDVYPQSKTAQCLLRGGKTENWGFTTISSSIRSVRMPMQAISLSLTTSVVVSLPVIVYRTTSMVGLSELTQGLRMR